MIRRYLEIIFRWLKRVISHPREELDRWEQAARFAYDLGRFGARQLRYDRAPQMAAALAFRALFGLVPVLVVATVLVRSLIGIDEFIGLITQLLAWARLDEVRILHPAGSEIESETLAQFLSGLIGEAANVELSAMGWVGLIVLVYAAISLLFTIENACNIIYRVPDGRSWVRRVPLYWFILTVSPVAIGLAAWLNGHFEASISTVEIWPTALVAIRLLWSCLCGWLLVFAVYMLIPNATVRPGPAAIGAVVTVLLLEIGKRVLGLVLENAFSISQLYGSFGLIPLFMFWVYLMWLAVLFGLQVSATLQMLHGRRLEEIERTRELTGLIEPASLITVMEVIVERFQAGTPATSDHIAESIGMPRATVREILERLIDAGLLHHVDADQGAVCLARPADRIVASQLIEIGFRMIDETGARRSALFEQLRNAQRDLAEQQTLGAAVTTASATS